MTEHRPKYKQADISIASYDAYIFTAIGGAFSADKADTLAAVAVVDCEIASRDRTVNQFTRNFYRAQAEQFRSILS
jgi:hypothetical protein